MTAKKTKNETGNGTKAPKAKKATMPTQTEAPAEAATVPPAPEALKATKMSALDAAARVLVETHGTLTCKEMIGAMAAKGYWSSPQGKTPHATLYAAILREINTKGDQSRFCKAGPGRFAFNAKTA